MFVLLVSCVSVDYGVDTSDSAVEPPVYEAADPVPAVRSAAEVTWTLEFDTDAEAAGSADCSYRRTFTGVQSLEQRYLCPACEALTWGEAEIVEGLDCYQQLVPDGVALTFEGWGYSTDGAFFRSGGENRPAGELAEFVPPAEEGDPVSLGWEAEYELTAGGAMVLSASGTFSWWTDETTMLEDPWTPRESRTSSCGWPRNNPGNLDLDYTLADGSTVPNVRLEDQCGELVDLWDFYGSWLILDSSQEDCGPCRTMAEQAPAFVAEMAAAGVELRMISLMGNGLDHPWGTPSLSVVERWVEAFALDDPVLADRGYAYSLFPAYLGAESFGYPAWIVVDPEMKLVGGQVGFSSWDAAREIIQASLDR
jgi:hypothetical protein